jgi:hypothetical protein
VLVALKRPQLQTDWCLLANAGFNLIYTLCTLFAIFDFVLCSFGFVHLYELPDKNPAVIASCE